MRLRILLIIFFIFLNIFFVKAEGNLQVDYKEGLLSVKAKDVTLQELFTEVVKKIQMKVIFYDYLGEEKVTLDFKNLGFNEYRNKIMGAIDLNDVSILYGEAYSYENGNIRAILHLEIGKVASIKKRDEQIKEKVSENSDYNILLSKIKDRNQDKKLRIVDMYYLDECKDRNENEIRLVLEELLKNDPDVEIRRQAARYLVNKESFPVLKKVFNDGKDKQVRLIVTQSLAKLGDGCGYYLARELVKDKEPAIRGEALIALGMLGQLESKKIVEEAFNDENDRVRIYANIALNDIGLKNAKDPINFLKNILERKDLNIEVLFSAALRATHYGQKSIDMLKKIKASNQGLGSYAAQMALER